MLRKKQETPVIMLKVVISIVCLNAVIVSTAIIEDPLQPVWNKIAQLSGEILRDIVYETENMVSNIDQIVENKAKAFTSSTKEVLESAEEMAKNIEAIISFLNNTFNATYKEQLQQGLEARVKSSTNHIKTSINEMQSKILRHLDQTLGKGDIVFYVNDSLEKQFSDIWGKGAQVSETINIMEGQLKQITADLPKNNSVSCAVKDSELRHFIDDNIPSRQRMTSFMKEWQATYQAIVDDPQAKAFYRDCSAILWINPQNQSGVYSIFPTRDIKREVQVWCDMTASSDKGGSVGGWTVILRRRNSTSELLNFNRTWSEYRDGFGVPDDTGEWWFGLKWLHMLTYQEPYEILFQMHDIERGYFLAHYSTFRVEDESNQFRLIVDGFSGNVSDAFKDKHHGMPFSTLDRDNDMCESCNCATNNGGGWWYNVCHWTVLTSMYPTSNDRTAKTIRWLSGTWLVLDDVTVMIRPNSFSP